MMILSNQAYAALAQNILIELVNSNMRKLLEKGARDRICSQATTLLVVNSSELLAIKILSFV